MWYILDSCILIDICNTDPVILDLLFELGPPHFLNEMREELVKLKFVNPQEIRVEYVDADFEDIEFANAEEGNSGLSWFDLLCMKTAARHGWTLITNDQLLRKRCQQENIATEYESYLIFALVKGEFLSHTRAADFIRSVCENNPRISRSVQKEALAKLEEL